VPSASLRIIEPVEEIDDLDKDVLSQLGYAMARAQLLEWAIAKLLEATWQDTTLPLDERWAEINRWLKDSAGRLSDQLGVPRTVARDLQQAVARRNQVAHKSWIYYRNAREKAQGDVASADWVLWLAEQAAILGRAYNGVIAMRDTVRQQGADDVEYPALEQAWRVHVPDPIEPL
jgi:hypothetical protein